MPNAAGEARNLLHWLKLENLRQPHPDEEPPWP
jgi:hypothetical protein